MKISADPFEAFLKCPTKCWLRAAGEPGSGNDYAEWVKSQTASYRATETGRLVSGIPNGEFVASPPLESLKSGKWWLAVDVLAQTPEAKPHGSQVAEIQTTVPETDRIFLTPAPANDQPGWIAESCLHVVERVPSAGRGRPAQFIPIRFIFTNS